MHPILFLNKDGAPVYINPSRIVCFTAAPKQEAPALTVLHVDGGFTYFLLESPNKIASRLRTDTP